MIQEAKKKIFTFKTKMSLLPLQQVKEQLILPKVV